MNPNVFGICLISYHFSSENCLNMIVKSGISSTLALSAIVVLIILAAAGWGAYAAFPSSKTVTSTQTITSTQTTAQPTSMYLQPTVSTASFTIEGFTLLPIYGDWYAGLPPYSNIFKQYIPDATFTTTSASTQIPTQLIQGSIQMAVLSPAGFVSPFAAGAPVSMVANLIPQPTLWTVFVAANSSITSMSQLHGKVFADGASGDTAGTVMEWMLQTYFGWKLGSDYTFSYLGALPSLLAAVQAGVAPASAISLNGFVPQLLSGQYRSIYNFTLPYPSAALFASNSFIQQHPDAVRATVEAFLAADKAWDSNTTGVASMLQSVYKMSPQAASIDAQSIFFSQDGSMSITANQQAVNEAFQGKAISQNFSIVPFISTQFVPVTY